MSFFLSEDWTAMRTAIMVWAIAEADPVPAIWKDQNAPNPPKPYVAVRLMSPPVVVGQASESNRRAIQVREADNATDYVVTLDDVAYTYTSDADATITEIRDGLMALIEVDYDGKTEVVAADVFALDLPSATIQINDTDLLAIKIAQQYLWQSELTLEVDGYFLAVPEGALEPITKMKLGIEIESVRAILAAAGLVFVGIVGSRRLSGVVNGVWENRIGFDLRLRALARRVDVLDYIEFADVGTGFVGTFTA